MKIIKFLSVCLMLILTSTTFAGTSVISAKAVGENLTSVVGSTNLPDNMELMFTITRDSIKYRAQASARIKNGTFEAGPFSSYGSQLPPGVYSLSISASVFDVKTYQNKISGPLLKNSNLGKYLSYKTTFQIGKGIASVELDKATIKKANKDKENWFEKSCKSACGDNECYKACIANPQK
jgi:hypothetical protein